MFTSGSTGAPKAVRMSQGRAARTPPRNAAVAFTSDDVLYCSMPLFHGNALLANLLPGLVAGATVVLRPRFSASAFLPDVRRHGCTYFNYVGRALSYILAQPETPDDGDNPLKWCLGSEASPRDREEFRRRFGCFVVEGYGSSEGAVVIQPFPGMLPEALGRPKEGMDVAVVDADTGEECPPARFGDGRRLLNAAEAIGEIVGPRRPVVLRGLLRQPRGRRRAGPQRVVLDRRPRLPRRRRLLLLRRPHRRLAARRRRELRRRHRSSASSAASRAWRRPSCTPCPTRAPATR